MKTLLPLKSLIALLALPLLLVACGSDDNDYNLGIGSGQQSTTNTNKNDASADKTLARLEFPHVRGGQSFVVSHTAMLNDKVQGINYAVEWDPAIQAQRWCCYQMYDEIVKGNARRYSGDRQSDIISATSAYPNDEFLPEEYQFTRDPYWGSGFDHGHICPSADRLASSEANRQTFFLTNMQPQANAFNAGIWESMENQVRSWSSTCDTLYVCKGGTIDAEANIIKYLGSGINKIPVPKYFFMALLAKNSQGYKALGFWVEHRTDIDKTTALASFVVNIRQLEQLTGIDFFCNLPDDTEQRVEALAVENVRAAWGLK